MFICIRQINHLLQFHQFSLLLHGDFPPRNKFFFSHFVGAHAFMTTTGEWPIGDANLVPSAAEWSLPHASKIRNNHIMDLQDPSHVGSLGE